MKKKKVIQLIIFSIVTLTILILPTIVLATPGVMFGISVANTAKIAEIADSQVAKESQKKTLEGAALKKMSECPDLVKKGYKPFEVGNVKIKDSWAFLNVFSVDANPPEKFDLIDSVSYLAIAQEKDDGSWDVYIETEKEFTEKKLQAPDTLISAELKNGLKSKYEADLPVKMQLEIITTRTEDEYHIPGLPYAVGEGWRYNQEPHGCGGVKCALDFGTPGGNVAGTVTAAEDGWISAVGDTCLKIRRYNSSLELLYQHINPEDIKNRKINDKVKLGETMGMTTLKSGTGICAGDTTGHHVHFQIHNTSLEGKSFNGWMISGNDIIKEGITRSPNSSFNAPTVLHGDWVIAKGSNCIVSFPGEAQIPLNVIVKNNSVLQVGNQGRLNIDFSHNKLQVENGSGVIINSGGGI